LTVPTPALNIKIPLSRLEKSFLIFLRKGGGRRRRRKLTKV
jgi:hypothetical protein